MTTLKPIFFKRLHGFGSLLIGNTYQDGTVIATITEYDNHVLITYEKLTNIMADKLFSLIGKNEVIEELGNKKNDIES